jgi:hypothetical protein
MPPIAAVLHTSNDALRLGRLLETLYPCDEILVVDHGSQDTTLHVAREYGARIIAGSNGASNEHYLRSIRSNWVLWLDPRESISEALAASLFEWKSETVQETGAVFSVFLREETAEGWLEYPAAQTRLVPSNWNRWSGHFPIADSSAVALEGELLRFAFP